MSPRFKSNNEIIEYLARLEHEQWIKWSRSVSDEVSVERKERWEKLWVPYEDLSESMKDRDREWAIKVMTVLNIIREDDMMRVLETLKDSIEDKT